MLNITSQWQDPEIVMICYMSILQKKIVRMLKTLVPKFRPDLSVRVKDIVEKGLLEGQADCEH